MIELSKHIEHLLLENDCVIVPEFGGFIAHHQPAHYEEAEGVFLPPIRTVGFNPQLTMNDGMLVQSYMQAYHTDFPDATRKIEGIVDHLKEQLYSKGIAEFHGIGTLRYNIYGMYEFEPNESGALSPSLYGLESFHMPLLTEKSSIEEPKAKVIEKPQAATFHTRAYQFMPQQWLGNAVAVAIAIIMFFVLSAPVENTYIDNGNYASLGTDCLFESIRSHSMATTLNTPVASDIPQRTKTKEPKPIVVKTEKVAPAPKTEIPMIVEAPSTLINKSNAVSATTVSTPHKEQAPVVKKSCKRYHIIVASLATPTDAKQSLQSFKQRGYEDVSIVEGNGRFRISLCSFTDKSSANRKLNELKQDNAFTGAWLLTSK